MGLGVAGRVLALFAYMLCLHSVAIFLFTRGFLLTRTELASFSACPDIAVSPCFSDSAQSGARSPAQGGVSQDAGGRGERDGIEASRQEWQSVACWTKPAVKRAIIIIIDALRFDFVAHSSNFAGEPQPWMDKLQVLQRLAEEERNSARIFKFVADPPTTTLQRLKGLTTGGLPTFVDIGHSFGAPAIVEDNLILQLVRRGLKVRMMGDDTWMKLFPSHFSEAHPFDSFNVKDLHTVDDGVIREIYPALQQPDWNVLIAHFLGVDHVGHIFGVESPLMVEKLEQYNRVIEEIVAVLKKESGPGGLHEHTMLLVLGDHGQTLHGDHGGGTSEEVETALFAMGMEAPPSPLPLGFQSSKCNMELETQVSQCITTFPQLDFSATMAALLGVPIPFGSVGRVNTELYALAAATWSSLNSSIAANTQSVVRDWMDGYKDVLCFNSWQVKRYLDTYAASSMRGFPATDLAHVQSLYTRAQSLTSKATHHNCSQSSLNSTIADCTIREDSSTKSIAWLTEIIQGYLAYLLAAADLARAQWTQFGDEWMAIGLSLLVASIVIHGVALSRALSLSIRLIGYTKKDPVVQIKEEENFQKLFPLKRMFLGCALMAMVASGIVRGCQLVAAALQLSAPASFLIGQSKIILPVTILLASIVAYLNPTMKKTPAYHREETTFGVQELGFCTSNVKSYAAILFVALHACALLSNSYIISDWIVYVVGEGLVVCFLLASSGILFLRQALQTGSKVPQALLFLVLNGGMASVGLVEIFKDPATAGGPALRDDYFPASYSPQLFITLSFVALTTTVLPLSSLAWLIIRRAHKLYSLSHSLYWAVTLSVPFAYSLLVLHWFTMDLAASVVIEIPQPFKEFSRLLCPQLVYSISLVLLLFTALVITYKSIKGGFLLTFGNSVVEAILAVLAGLSGTIILLLGRKGPTITLLAVLEVWCLLDLQGLGSLDQKMKEVDRVTSGDEIIRSGLQSRSHFAAAVDWNLVAVQLFFCTGHRCTFDGLHYTAAFIGFDEFYFYRQGALLAADTFGSSHILPVIGLPLLVTAAGVESFPALKSSVGAENKVFAIEICKAYISYGLVRAILTTVTTVCVALQRRHLMISFELMRAPVALTTKVLVWGLFAPKYVFDAVGLLVVDIFIVIALSFYFSLLPRRRHNI